MATTNDKFREDLENLNNQSLQKGSILEKLWNALLEFLGLKNLSQLTKDYVTSEIFQYIETINESKSESQKITQPTKIFDNEKYREVEKLMEEIEISQDDVNVKFEAGEREFDLIPEFNEQLIPTDSEVELLEKIYGKDFMIGYNKLTDVEKQSILKCLK